MNITDLEKENFLLWYKSATLRDVVNACKENPTKFHELQKKYASELKEINFGKGNNNAK